MGNYPSHRNQYPVYWHARAGAAVDDAPLPVKTAARTIAIRRVFLAELHGRATIQDVGDRCDTLGLLDGLSTHRSCTEALMRALRPIATTNYWASAHAFAPVSSPLPPG